MEAVDMLRLMLVVELRPLAVGRFSRSTGWVRCDHHHFQKYHNDQIIPIWIYRDDLFFYFVIVLVLETFVITVITLLLVYTGDRKKIICWLGVWWHEFLVIGDMGPLCSWWLVTWVLGDWWHVFLVFGDMGSLCFWWCSPCSWWTCHRW